MEDHMTLAEMAQAVTDVNLANGWFDVNPKVQEFMDWARSHLPATADMTNLEAKATELFGPRTVGDDIALLHSEVSEMLEEFRERGMERLYGTKNAAGEKFDFGMADGDEYPSGAKPLGFPSECADVLIRLLDTCFRHNIDLESEFKSKLAYNATRGYKHGGKAL